MQRTERLSEQKTDMEQTEQVNRMGVDTSERPGKDANTHKISRRKLRARELNLPANATWGEIAEARSEQERIERIQQLGLQENATWGEIFHHMNEIERQNVAAALGLGPSASWRRITTQILDLPGTASDQEIIAKIRRQTINWQQDR